MNTQRTLLRGAALLGAVVLLTGYVYQRAGGGLLEKLGVVEAPRPAVSPETAEFDALMFAGSKSGMAIPPPGPTVTGDLLPGSKTLIIVNPVPATGTPVPQDQLFPGSKSEILIDPFPAEAQQPEVNPRRQAVQEILKNVLQQQEQQRSAQPNQQAVPQRSR